MACRAAAWSGHPCHALLLLCGNIPEELKEDRTIRFPPILLARGRTDDWYTREKMDLDLEFLNARHVPVQPLVFEGGHAWSEEYLQAAGAFLRRIADPGARRE
jgi:predicted esterase